MQTISIHSKQLAQPADIARVMINGDAPT